MDAQTPAAAAGREAERVVVLACPADAHTQRHAHAAQGAFADKFGGGGAYVVATPTTTGGASVASEDVATADGQEHALSLVLQRLQSLQLQRSAFGAPSASLLSRAKVLAAVQPCIYRLKGGGATRSYACYWVGAVDLDSGRTATGASVSTELHSESQASSPGLATRSAFALDEDAAASLGHAWKSLVSSL